MTIDSERRRVVITGVGAITPLGVNAESTWQGMCAGRSAIDTITTLPLERLRNHRVAAIREFKPESFFDSKKVGVLDRVSQLAVVAGREAMTNAGIELCGNLDRMACVVGCGVGGETTHDEQSRRYYEEKRPRLHPFTILRIMVSAPTSHLAMEFGITGPCLNIATACASSNHAMAVAAGMVREGRVDVALTGGAESCFGLTTMKAWEALRIMSEDTCRPFSKDREGMILGEGAALYVFEEYEHAKRRGVPIIGEFLGAGFSTDATDLILPNEDQITASIRNAMIDAKLNPEDIDYINAHGTGTPANDPTETRAIRRTLGSHADQIPVSSTKSMLGHALGAAGAIEMLAVLGAIRDGIVPPTANYSEPDPECDLDYVPNFARERRVVTALSNSFAFGGLNCVVAVRRI